VAVCIAKTMSEGERETGTDGRTIVHTKHTPVYILNRGYCKEV